MKKFINLILIVILLSCLLSACSCNHKWENATCISPAVCSKCGETLGEPLGHSWIDATCTTPKTCSVCNITEGEALGHTWQEATCMSPKTCSLCNQTEGEALGHTWQDATCTAPKTCSVCNATDGEALGHTWREATCTEPKTCSVCNSTEGKALGHDYKGLSCTENGICSRCNEVAKATGHSWKDATCTTPKTCKVCGIQEGEPLGHTSGEKCSRCGYIDKSYSIENAKNLIHIYGIDLDMNSVGGVDTYITWRNESQKEIKYIDFYVQYYNRVKDIVSNEIDGSTTTILSSTGPYPYGKGNYTYISRSLPDGPTTSYYFTVESGYNNDKENGWAGKFWEAPFYNSTTKYVKIIKIEIEYMDGSAYTISDEDAISAVVGDGTHINYTITTDTSDDYLR